MVTGSHLSRSHVCVCVWDESDLKGKGLAQKKEEGTQGWERGRWQALRSSTLAPS